MVARRRPCFVLGGLLITCLTVGLQVLDVAIYGTSLYKTSDWSQRADQAQQGATDTEKTIKANTTKPKTMKKNTTKPKTTQTKTTKKKTIKTETKVHITTKADIYQRNFDMTFWSETPIISNNASTSDVFVVHSYRRNSTKVALHGFQEVFRVAFRVCKTTCPQFKTLSSKQLSGIKKYRRIIGKELEILSPKAETDPELFRPEKLSAVTFWSEEHQHHIRFAYRGNLDPNYCHPSISCPKRCPRDPPEHPYMFDTRDRVCKSTHPDAMPPHRTFGGPCGCTSTCYTPKAVTYESTWPWKNKAQRNSFAPYWNDPALHSSLINTRKMSQQLRRQLPFSRYEARFSCNKTIIPPPIVGDFKSHLIFFPEAKLIFCGIPKVGITEWMKFLRHSIGAQDYRSMPHSKQDREGFFLGNLPISRAIALLDDPTWTKAAFIRNPLERLVSAYQDKIVRRHYTQLVFNISGDTDENRTMSFSEFVDKVTTADTSSECSYPNGLSACTDVHWKPQIMTCGLDYLLPKFDFVGNFDYVAEQTKVLLEKVGVWDTWGRTYDDGTGAEPSPSWDFCHVMPIKRKLNETTNGFNQRGASVATGYDHSTNSKNKLDAFYSPDLIQKVRRAYALDFSVWDEISKKAVGDVSHGKDLNVVREYCSGQT